MSAEGKDNKQDGKMAELLRTSEERYRLLFESANDAIFVHDMNGRFLEANRRACEMLGYSREELLYLRMQDLAVDGAGPAAQRIRSIELAGNGVFETSVTDKLGQLIPVEVSASIINYQGRKAVQAVARDTSERKRSEEEILRWNRELARLSATTTALIKINHLISSSLDMNQVWQVFTNEVRKLIPLDRIGVILLQEQGMMQVLTFAGEWQGMPSGLMRVLPGSAEEWVLKHRVPHIEEDLAEDRQFSEDVRLYREGIRSVIRIPIFSKGKLVGILFLDSKHPGSYSEHHLTMLEPIAVQLAITLDNQRLYQELQERERQARVLYELTAAFNSTLDPQEILRALAEKTMQALQASSCEVGLVDEDELSWAIVRGLPEDAIKSLRFKEGEGIVGRAWQTRQIQVVKDLSTDSMTLYRETAVSLGLRSMICVPIVLSDEVLGILEACTSEVREYTPDEIALLGVFAAQAAVAINNARNFQEIKRAKEKIEEMSQRDFLTGLYNRQFFESLYRKEIERAQRYHRPVTVAMMDLDDLKRINDIYGHQMGDAVLAAVGEVLRQTLRQVDLAGRYGGDEIVVAFPETELGEARRAIKRIREALERINSEGRFPFSVRLSIGLSYACGDYSGLLQAADEEMYKDKQGKAGRL
ncbi:hypothetical protein SY88_11270 [Clostridiales bacterium PH28_bin88]|nr:hypothetical protein SY88_11270 [Clostridiales bacterium PH28_bin88]